MTSAVAQKLESKFDAAVEFLRREGYDVQPKEEIVRGGLTNNELGWRASIYVCVSDG